MKAYTLLTPTGPDGLRLRELSTYPLGSDNVLLKTHALSINPIDLKTSHGKGLYDKLRHDDPLILGWDVAGEVVELGSPDLPYAIGDRLFGMVNFPGQGSAHAEYVTISVNDVVRIPEGVSYEDAAATTLAALTAWQNLIELGKLQSGQRVLIHGAGGGVGHFAVQLAKERGAYVIATSSGDKRDFVLGLGADEHIDYAKEKFEDRIEPVDIVLDSRDEDHLKRSMKVVKPGGHLFSIGAHLNDELKQLANERGIAITRHLVHANGEQMQALADRLAAGRLKPHVSQTYPFDRLQEALRELERGHTRGKIVVVP